jgi:hypothetical protein
MQPHLRRRTLLGLSVWAVTVPTIAGCTSTPQPSPQPTAPTESPAIPDDSAVRDGAARGEAELISRYSATMTAHPALAGALAPIADQHRQHRQALLGDTAVEDGDTGAVETISPDPAVALTDLIAAERAAAEARTADCDRAQQVDVIRLLALIAASEASHAEALSTSDSTP